MIGEARFPRGDAELLPQLSANGRRELSGRAGWASPGEEALADVIAVRCSSLLQTPNNRKSIQTLKK